MEQQEIKEIIAKLLAEGMSLSKIQSVLKDQHQISMTFLNLRLLASEIENVDWTKQNKPEPKKKPAPAAKPQNNGMAPAASDENDEFGDEAEPLPDSGSTPAGSGATVVELNKLVRPGALACGKVSFGSGAQAEWILDQFGRLALDKAVGKPTQQDIQEFQVELQKLLARSGL
jgi:hypothetical protein